LYKNSNARSDGVWVEELTLHQAPAAVRKHSTPACPFRPDVACCGK